VIWFWPPSYSEVDDSRSGHRDRDRAH
jgi:hypothetical protein